MHKVYFFVYLKHKLFTLEGRMKSAVWDPCSSRFYKSSYIIMTHLGLLPIILLCPAQVSDLSLFLLLQILQKKLLMLLFERVILYIYMLCMQNFNFKFIFLLIYMVLRWYMARYYTRSLSKGRFSVWEWSPTRQVV